MLQALWLVENEGFVVVSTSLIGRHISQQQNHVVLTGKNGNILFNIFSIINMCYLNKNMLNN